MKIKITTKRPAVFYSVLIIQCAICFGSIAFAQDQHSKAKNLDSMSLEELMHVEVTSASKRPEDMHTTASAVYVISNQDIKQGTARNIPDLLRTVPGLNVAQFDANKWFVSIRGFNKLFANQLLVLVDGKTTYTQFFSGVYWDSVDVILEDIERIEIIRGPGSAVWGANAVNGVINIITKSAKDTQGLYARAGGGNYMPLSSSLRYGEALSDQSFARYWAKTKKIQNYNDSDGIDAHDATDSYRGGLRFDSELDNNEDLSLILNGYKGLYRSTAKSNSIEMPEGLLSKESDYGAGLTAQAEYNVEVEKENNWNLKGFYDRFWREAAGTGYYSNTFDLELKNVRDLNDRFTLVSGLGARFLADKVYGSEFLNVSTDNPEQYYTLLNTFFQAEYALIPESLDFTLGTKLEHNDYTGLEFEPTARLGYRMDDSNFVWSSFTRAARTPSRVNDNIKLADYSLGVEPTTGLSQVAENVPSMELDSEISYSYELGYRALLNSSVSLDLAAFITNYQGLIGNVPAKPMLSAIQDRPVIYMPVDVENSMHAESKGFEAALAWKPAEDLDFKLAYTCFDLSIQADADRPAGTATNSLEADTPGQNISVTGRYKVLEDLDVSTLLSYVGAAASMDVDSYFRLDLKAAYSINESLKFNLYGQNLIEEHIEGQNPILLENTEIPRMVFAELEYSY